MDISNYSLLDIQRGLEKVYDDITTGKYTYDNPKAFILGGQSGAGKTTLHKIFFDHYLGNIVIINADDYRRFHPHYDDIYIQYGNEAANYTQSIANAIANALVEKLSDEGFNIVVEGTCRRADVPLKACRDLKEKGYIVELSVMCTSEEISWQSTIDRYNEMAKIEGMLPRAVP